MSNVTATTVSQERHSRSRVAGYEPEVLFGAHVLLAGLGALGQNVAQNLALAGVGNIWLIDFDYFEDHNRTRSPLYPTSNEQLQWGLSKATVVANKLLPLATAPEPHIFYSAAPLQSLGTMPIVWADLVCAAVDNARARAWLAQQCRLLGKPLVEGGFHGSAFNCAVYGTDAGDPCWRCQYPSLPGAFSCSQYAQVMESQGFIPAIQNSAAALAAYQAEMVIQWLHGERPNTNLQVFGDVRTHTLSKARLQRDRDCPALHWTSTEPPLCFAIDPSESVTELLAAVQAQCGSARLLLPEPVVLCNTCTACGTLVQVRAPQWRWLADPRCMNCGGPYAVVSGRAPQGLEWLDTEDPADYVSLRCRDAGLATGCTLHVVPREGASILGQIGGDIAALRHRVLPES